MRKMIGCCKQFVFSSFSKFLCTIVLLVSITNVGRGQSYLGLNGGVEGGTTIDNANLFTSGQPNKWSKTNVNQTIATETAIVRSGNSSLRITNTTATGRRIYSPTFSPTAGQRLVIQYYRLVQNTTNTQQSHCEISRDGAITLTAAQATTYTIPATANTWEKVTFAPTSTDYVAVVWAAILHRQTGTGGNLFIDDVSIYTATSVDNTAPNPPTSANIGNPTSSTLDISWNSASGGEDGGGYLVVRHTSDPTTVPNVNGIYAIGNTIGTGTVVYQGSSTSFTDNSLSAGTTYYYRIYTYDKAYNYSSALTGNGGTSGIISTLNSATLSSPLSTTYGTASAGVSFTASGTNLTGNITATAQTGYEVSTDNSNFSSSVSVGSGSLVYVRFAATQNAGTYNGATAVQLSSTGATNVNITTSAANNIVSTKSLTVNEAAANNKIYDGTNAATIAGILNGIVGSDDVSLNGTGTFAQTNVGDGIVVTSTSTLSGTKAANYTLTQPSGLSANIIQRTLTITANDVTKAPGALLTGGAGSTAFTSSGLAGAETVGTVTINYGSAGATTGEGNTVGIYSNQVTPSSATGGTFNPANYTITYIGGSINVTLNEIGDYRTRSTMPGNVGNWGVNTSWEKWDGSNWIACSVGDFPDIGTANVTIRSGHTIDNDGAGTPPWDVKNLTVETGAKLWDNQFGGVNSYIQVYGNILCNGTIGDPLGDDISFDIAGGNNCTISGTGSFTATRIRKDATINPSLNTTLTVDMDIRLTWSSSSGTVLYNDGTTSNFNVTINAGKTVRCSGPGSAWGNVAIDGSNFSSPSTSEAGGSINVNGTLDMDGILFAYTDNTINPCSILINNGGILKCRYIRADASGTAGNVLRVLPGGRLNIFGSVDTVAAANQTTWNNFSTTNNTWDFQPGSTLEYSGTTRQSVNGITQCSNFTVSGGGAKTLANPFIIDRILTLTNGLVNTTSTNILTLTSNATCPGGGSFNSFINGPMRKEGSSDFKFPVGKTAVNRNNISNTGNVTNGGYRPISISGLIPNSNSNFLAEYQLSNPYLQGTINPLATAAGLQGISRCEYWDLVKETGTQTPIVTLTWSDNATAGQSQCNVGPYIINPIYTFVVPYYNGMWGDQNSTYYGRSGITTPTNPLLIGEIIWDGTSGQIDSYLKFVIGTTNWQQAPLPYTLSTFKATAKEKVVQLDWQVLHNDRVRTYTVERSKDGVRFAPLKLVAARVNEQNAAYLDNDPAPFKGWGYYRLRITDFDGNSTYSAIQKVWMGNAPIVQVSPNPVKDQLFINTANMAVKEISLINYLGQTLLRTIPISSNTILDLSKFNAGVYYVRILTNEGVLTEQVIKQ